LLGLDSIAAFPSCSLGGLLMLFLLRPELLSLFVRISKNSAAANKLGHIEIHFAVLLVEE
jgi:hypothetical protein